MMYSNNNHSATNNNSNSSNHDRERERERDRLNHHHHNRSPSSVSPPLRHHPSSPLGGHMMPMPHPLSPPQTSTPNSIAAAMGPRMAQSLPHLAPHSLGLLNSLQMMHHANPLELMAAAHHHVPPRSYNSPPPISTSDPTANECKLVDYRGQKVAAFIIAGDTMLCLPQAFELFLKHLVGGLHTVYTKLKRLDIVPLVCNVEQVRILRGLGAIQPGVNRCKLLSCKDFDILYRDCTTARYVRCSCASKSKTKPHLQTKTDYQKKNQEKITTHDESLCHPSKPKKEWRKNYAREKNPEKKLQFEPNLESDDSSCDANKNLFGNISQLEICRETGGGEKQQTKQQNPFNALFHPWIPYHIFLTESSIVFCVCFVFFFCSIIIFVLSHIRRRICALTFTFSYLAKFQFFFLFVVAVLSECFDCLCVYGVRLANISRRLGVR